MIEAYVNHHNKYIKIHCAGCPHSKKEGYAGGQYGGRYDFYDYDEAVESLSEDYGDYDISPCYHCNPDDNECE